MIKVFIADDKDLNKVCSGIIDNEDCILNGNVEVFKTKYVKTKSFEGGDFETGEMLIKNTKNLSLAILDIYFDEEFGRMNKEGGKILADLIRKYHPSCQIVIMTKSNSDPELLEDYDAFRDGRKFLSICKNHMEVDFDEYNSVFSTGLKEWLKLTMMSVGEESDRKQIIKDLENNSNFFRFKGLTLNNFRFFLNNDEFKPSYFIQFFDLDIPPVKIETLLNNDGLANKRGRCLIKHPLIMYYYEWYNRPDFSESLSEINNKATKYLDQAINVYMLCGVVSQDSYSIGNPVFKDSYKVLAQCIKSENLSLKGEINDPKDKSEIVRFTKRLWFRLFCLGLYFIQVSKSDIARFTNQIHKLEDEPSSDALKIFTSSLWLYGFENTVDSYERDYDQIWSQLANYEKVFLKQWFHKFSDSSNAAITEYRNLSHLDSLK